jgi:hypothetical protein
MMHFWNVYEVPAFDSGILSPAHPRIGRRLLDSSATGGSVGISSSSSSADTSPLHSGAASSSPHRRMRSATNPTASSTQQGVSSSSTTTDGIAASGEGRERSSSQRGSRFMIQLPNFDVTRPRTSNPPFPSSYLFNGGRSPSDDANLPPVIPSSEGGQHVIARKKRSNTENDISEILFSPLAATAAPSSSIQSPPSSSLSHNEMVDSPDSMKSPNDCGIVTGRGGGESKGNRQRSLSNMSIGSNSSTASATTLERLRQALPICESMELRKMRLEQEKLKYNIHQPTTTSRRSFNTSSGAAAVGGGGVMGETGGSGIASNSSSMLNSPVTPKYRERGEMTPERSPLLLVKGKQPQTNNFSTPASPARSIQFPLTGGGFSSSSSSVPATTATATATVSSNNLATRDVLSKDELIGFFLDDLSPNGDSLKYSTKQQTPTSTFTSTSLFYDDNQRQKPVAAAAASASLIAENNSNLSQQQQHQQQISPKGFNKNYSFNVFGDVYEEDD